jgi:dTDP-4-amino-4,6-dideoxygalactose transaminase
MTYRVPFVDYPKQYLSMEKEIDAAVKAVFQKGDFILRQAVTDFESRAAAFIGVKHVIGVSNGTDALILSLKAAGIKAGDEVITVAHTFVASIAAIVHVGATPVLVDVGEDMEMDVDKLETAITPRTRAVMPVHFNGRMCHMGRLMEIARKHKLLVIEDACQALGATFEGKKAGSFGLTGCFSFYPAKLLGAAGDAGCVSTNDDGMNERIRSLRDHGRRNKDELVGYGFTNRLDNLQAAILNVKLNYVPAWIERRRRFAGMYDRGLAGVPGLKLPVGSGGPFQDIYQNYVLRVQKRDALAAWLKEQGVETIISNPIPIHFQKALGLEKFRLPVTEQLAGEVITIPNVPELEDSQIRIVIDTIREFYKK